MDRVYLKGGRKNREGGARWKEEKEGQRAFGKTSISFLSLDSEHRREGLGATGPAGVGNCRRSQAWQRPRFGAKGRGDRGGSIPTLTLGRGGARGQLHRRRWTAGSGGWGGLGGSAVERKEWLWGFVAR
jgi:hypothetical protein